MKPDDRTLPLALSRPVPLMSLSSPVTMVVRPDENECAAIARLGRMASLTAFEARLTLTPRADGTILVEGPLRATANVICVVSLEPFPQAIAEEVEAVFAEAPVIARLEKRAAEAELDFDPPDEILDGQIDVGALAVEFLMLALDPYPRKPGIRFDEYRESEAKESPFAALKALKSDPDA